MESNNFSFVYQALQQKSNRYDFINFSDKDSMSTLTPSTISASSQKQPSQCSDNPETKIKVPNKSKEVRYVSKREIEELNDRVKSQLARNKKTYDKVLSLNPYFTISLFVPSNTFGSQQYTSVSIDMMIKQLELLLDEGRTLERQLMKAQLKQMQRQHRDSDNMEWRHQYAYLRKIWLNNHESQSTNSMDIIDNLSKKVALVKANLSSMTEIEKKSFQNRHSSTQYEHVTRKINEMVHQNFDYQELKEKYENLKMAYEDIYQQLENKGEEMTQKIGERNEVIRQLKYDNEEYRKTIKDLKEKLLQSQLKEAKLMKKMNQSALNHREHREQNSNKLQKLIASSKAEILGIQSIKFQKLEPEFLKKMKQPEHFILESKKTQNKCFQSPQMKKEDENTNHLNEPNKDRHLELSDVKSTDGKQGKKGRFTRMRSPVGSKLYKPQPEEEETSQRLLGMKPPTDRELKSERGQQMTTST